MAKPAHGIVTVCSITMPLDALNHARVRQRHGSFWARDCVRALGTYSGSDGRRSPGSLARRGSRSGQTRLPNEPRSHGWVHSNRELGNSHLQARRCPRLKSPSEAARLLEARCGPPACPVPFPWQPAAKSSPGHNNFFIGSPPLRKPASSRPRIPAAGGVLPRRPRAAPRGAAGQAGEGTARPRAEEPRAAEW